MHTVHWTCILLDDSDMRIMKKGKMPIKVLFT